MAKSLFSGEKLCYTVEDIIQARYLAVFSERSCPMPKRSRSGGEPLPIDPADFLTSEEFLRVTDTYERIRAFAAILPPSLDEPLRRYNFKTFLEIVEKFAANEGLSPDAGPDELIACAEKHRDAFASFVRRQLKSIERSAAREAEALKEDRADEYLVLGNSPTTFFLAGVWANMKRGREFHPQSNGVKVEYSQPDAYGNQNIRYINKDYELTLMFEAVQEYTKSLSWTAHRLLVYTLIQGNIQNWRGNSATFSITDYMQWSGLKSRDATYKQLKNDIRSITGVKITAESFKKYFESFYTTHLAVEAEIKKYTGEVRITFAEKVRLFLTQYYELIPEWSGQLGENAYRIIFYTFYRARKDRNTADGYLNIAIADIINYIGLPTKAEVKNRNYDEAIIRPFNKAIEEIEQVSGGAVQFEFAYDNINDFLSGYLKVLVDENLSQYLKKLAGKRQTALQAGEGAKPRSRRKKKDPPPADDT